MSEPTEFTDAVVAMLRLLAKTDDELETMRRQWTQSERLLIVYRQPDAPDGDDGKILFIDPAQVHIGTIEEKTNDD